MGIFSKNIPRAKNILNPETLSRYCLDNTLHTIDSLEQFVTVNINNAHFHILIAQQHRCFLSFQLVLVLCVSFWSPSDSLVQLVVCSIEVQWNPPIC